MATPMKAVEEMRQFNKDDLVRVRTDGGPMGGIQRQNAGRRGVVTEVQVLGGGAERYNVRFERGNPPQGMFEPDELELIQWAL